MLWILALLLSLVLCLQSLYLIAMTIRKRTKFHILVCISSFAAMLTLVYVVTGVFFLYFIGKSVVWVVGSWVILTVFAYRRPTVRLRVYEYSVTVLLTILIRMIPGKDAYIASLLILTVHGLFICKPLTHNAEDEFAIGITARERKNPFYLRWIKKVAYEEVYVPPSLVGNKDIRQTSDYLRKGIIFFAFVHLLGILELVTFAIGFENLSLCIDIVRIGAFQMIFFFAAKIVN